jgi:hypothetical protein
MVNFDPPKPAYPVFRSMFGQLEEITPLGRAGNSHFGYYRADGSWHVTTQIEGIGKRDGIENGFRFVWDFD